MSTVIKRLLVFVHRWMGAALSVIFMLWFVSGIVMMYWTFPGVSAQDRLQRAPVLDPASVSLSAEEAFARVAPGEVMNEVLLTSFDGRPVYLSGGTMVYADDGTEPGAVDDGMIDRAAVAWSGRPLGDATKESVDEVDQWTVSGELRRLRPLFKYSWPDGQQVYVNGATADVVQYTTTRSRTWAYLGAIPHWLYFTPLRTEDRQWFSFLVWSALGGTVVALLGLVIGAWMYSPAKSYRYAGTPTAIPYRGWKRWHMVAGLVFGVVAATWVFSGLLSLGPFPVMARLLAFTMPAETTAERAAAGAVLTRISSVLRGGRLEFSSYAQMPPGVAIRSLANFDVKELEYTSFAGEPMYLAWNARGETRIIPVRGVPLATFDPNDLMRRIDEAAGGQLAELGLMDDYDAYYRDRERRLPLPVIYVRMNDAARSRFYINPKTATITSSYRSDEWVNRWLYHGLHSLDFPWLYRYRPLWDAVVITLMLGGTLLCMTALIMTWRVVVRTAVSVFRARANPPAEDLAPESER